jgi:hypothetical protein
MNESKNQKSFWTRLPSILTESIALVAAIVGLIGGLVAVGIVGGDERPGPVPPLPTVTPAAAQPTATPDLVSTHRPSLMSAIRLLGDLEAQAVFSLDPTSLYNGFKGEALRLELAGIENLQRNGVYAVAKRQDLQFNEFIVSPDPDGLRAEVSVEAIWETAFYRIGTTICISRLPPHSIPQTVFLEQTSSGWVAYAIEFDATPPNPVPC